MKKAILSILLAFVFFFPKAPNAKTYDPRQTPNNPFGIHILSENDIKDAQNLVNTAGGDWGYVTLVIRQDQRNIQKWQSVFDQLREARLIPIVRIASQQKSGYWSKLQKDDIRNWVYFLNSLNWIVKNRYVVVGNEPNHKKEWGNDINPGEYAEYLKDFGKKARSANENFFILPAGLDASAPDGLSTMSEEKFLEKMKEAEPDIFSEIDGWTSHSYPNPGFSGSWQDTGKGSIKTYKWEIEYLKSIGVEKDLPIFITETGWAHNADGKVLGLKDENQVAEEIASAYQNIWKDPSIVAVTPFVLNYTSEPFDQFSWKKSDGSFYNFYEKVSDIPKKAGSPIQKEEGTINHILTIPSQDQEDTFWGIAYFTNTGQTIWEAKTISLSQKYKNTVTINPHFLEKRVKPGEETAMFFKIGIKESTDATASVRLVQNEKVISTPYRFEIKTTKKPEEDTLTKQKELENKKTTAYDIFWQTTDLLLNAIANLTPQDELLASI